MEMTKDYGDKNAVNLLSFRFRRDVFVRSPPRGGLSVTGMSAWRIASTAAAHNIPIQELTPRSMLLNVPYR
jgi:hypothetical protein